MIKLMGFLMFEWWLPFSILIRYLHFQHSLLWFICWHPHCQNIILQCYGSIKCVEFIFTSVRTCMYLVSAEQRTHDVLLTTHWWLAQISQTLTWTISLDIKKITAMSAVHQLWLNGQSPDRKVNIQTGNCTMSAHYCRLYRVEFCLCQIV